MGRGRPFKCPYESCGSTETVSRGVRKTKTMGLRNIRRCKTCGRKFTPQSQRPSEGCAAKSEQQPTPDTFEQPGQGLEPDQRVDQGGATLDNPIEDEHH